MRADTLHAIWPILPSVIVLTGPGGRMTRANSTRWWSCSGQLAWATLRLPVLRYQSWSRSRRSRSFQGKP